MSLKPGSHIHLMGICGVAMGSLAGILKNMGFKVTGSDQNIYPPMSTQLKGLGIEIMQGYKKENLTPRPDLVVVGNVISKNFEEAEELFKSDIPYTSLPKAVGDFIIEDRNSIVLTGTHGKTTMTSMMAWVSEVCKKNAGYLVGGIPINFNQSFRSPQSPWFIIEGDEYDTAFFDKVPKFIYYKPKYVVLSSIEFDHADIYDSVDEIKESFKRLIELIPKEGALVCRAEDKNIQSLIKFAKCKVVTYGFEKADYCAFDRQNISGRNHFIVNFEGSNIADIALKQFGPHNTLNSLAVYALAREMGWPMHKVLQGLASFTGVKRRQEVIGEPQGITLVEDFAHHPTAVSLTIDCMREAYGNERKLFTVFEPRSATARRNIFFNDYIEAFKKADVVILPKAFDQGKIDPSERFDSKVFIKELKKQGVEAYFLPEIDEIIEFIKQTAKPKDVVLLMSNGAFGGIYKKLIKALKP